MNKNSFKNSNTPPTGDAPMEQVREILFGAQLKELEVRFKRQEESFLREIYETKDFFKKRLDSLENFMKSEVSSILNRLKQDNEEKELSIKHEQRERIELVQREQRERNEAIAREQRERAESINRIAAEMTISNERLEKKMSQLSEAWDATERELKKLVLSESNSLAEKIESNYNDSIKHLSKTASQIRADMVYRGSLSSMLTEMVISLGKPWADHESEDQMAHITHNDYTAPESYVTYEPEVEETIWEENNQ